MRTEALTIRELRRDERAAAAAVLARGMRDNPVHVAAFGDDAHLRQTRLERLFRAWLEVMDQQVRFGAVLGGALVGVAAVTPPGRCRPGPWASARMAARLLPVGAASLARVLHWQQAWQRLDPERPHVHLGPVAVDRPLQGRGIGSALLAACTRLCDETGAAGYLETDKAANVAFYERHGFEVVAETAVLGRRSWFMLRTAV